MCLCMCVTEFACAKPIGGKGGLCSLQGTPPGLKACKHRVLSESMFSILQGSLGKEPRTLLVVKTSAESDCLGSQV